MSLVSSGSNPHRQNLSLTASPQLTHNQLQADATTHSFSTQVTGAEGVVGMLAGGLVGRGVRALSFASLGTVLGSSSLAFQSARAGSWLLGLAGESAAFTGVGRTLHGQGFAGFGQDWLHSSISLGSLKLAGLGSAGQNVLVQRAVNSSAMVAANQIAAAVGIIDHPHEALSAQFAQALVMDIQSSFTRCLIDIGLPTLTHFERNLDAHYSREQITRAQTVESATNAAGTPMMDRALRLFPRLASIGSAFGAALLHAVEGRTQPLHEGVTQASSVFHSVLHGAWATSGVFTGVVLGAAIAYLGPVFKGKYKAGINYLPLALGAGLLATRLGSHFSTFSESAGNLAFLGMGIVGSLAHEAWLYHRVNDRKRIHLWQHNTPREEYVRTRSVEGTDEIYRQVMDAPPVEINPQDRSWSHGTLYREGAVSEAPVARDVDGYPLKFVRFVHDAPPKSAGFLNGNYFYNRALNGPKVTALIESAMSTLPMTWLYGKLNRVPGRSIRDYLVAKFNVTYPERFDWNGIRTFNDFFTRRIVTPPEGLEVIEGQTFHDGVLDVVGRTDLDTGIRLAGKGAVEKVWSETEGRHVDVVGDAVLPLRTILGRAARYFEGQLVTVVATYLSPRHWHQTLSPVSGRILDIQAIEGKLHSVDPGIRHIPSDPNFDGRPASNFQSENSRVVVTIETEEYGPVSLICTAAALVSTSRVFARAPAARAAVENHSNPVLRFLARIWNSIRPVRTDDSLRVGDTVRVGELLHEYRWGSHNTIVMRSDRVVLAPNLVPGRQVYVRGTRPADADGIEWLFAPRGRLR